MTRCALALGEVPWERALLAAALACPDIEVVRRHVDAASAMQEDGVDLLLVAPTLRGFDAPALAAMLRRSTRVVVLLDTVRPPWLASSGAEQHVVDGLDFDALLTGLLSDVLPFPSTVSCGHDRITAFAGTGGGVGTTTLACVYALQSSGRRYVEADPWGTSASLLLGDRRPAPADAPDVVLDVGRLDLEAPRDDWGRLVLVTPATTLGIVRAGAMVEALEGRPVTLVVNRVRASALGSGRVSALRTIVERATGVDPVLVPERTADCDAAWLHADARGILDLVPKLPESVVRAEHDEAA